MWVSGSLRKSIKTRLLFWYKPKYCQNKHHSRISVGTYRKRGRRTCRCVRRWPTAGWTPAVRGYRTVSPLSWCRISSAGWSTRRSRARPSLPGLQHVHNTVTSEALECGGAVCNVICVLTSHVWRSWSALMRLQPVRVQQSNTICSAGEDGHWAA